MVVDRFQPIVVPLLGSRVAVVEDQLRSRSTTFQHERDGAIAGMGEEDPSEEKT
jgi:hypothetical protein